MKYGNAKTRFAIPRTVGATRPEIPGTWYRGTRTLVRYQYDGRGMSYDVRSRNDGEASRILVRGMMISSSLTIVERNYRYGPLSLLSCSTVARE